MTKPFLLPKGKGYDNGDMIAMTLGHFIGLLVDAGQDPAVVFRVIEDGQHDENGKFTRKIEVTLLPDGYVIEAAKKSDRIHKDLKALIDAGVVT